MEFIADFHIHSRFSRATAKNLDLENLYIAAQLKGIRVVGTGDFTHPGWFAEIKEKLIPAEEGLYQLKHDIAKQCDRYVPKSCRDTVRFMLVSEISSIYKKKKKTRKNHNLVFMPDMEAAKKFNTKLSRIGNINSDGRPILGLDARDLLEILLEVSDSSFLVPAHIWTPWFSLFGSKSGFDSIEECFEDLTPHIFALETGLSSDPAMNWRISKLDNLTLISNSDAHSPLKMGRECNMFDTELSFSAIKGAMEKGDPKKFLGTIEFYPEEGKYHLDGHRKCSVRLSPSQTKKSQGICPVCQKPLTLGVMYRVEELADRSEGAKPEKTFPFYNRIPLVEILADVLKVGCGSKRVKNNYMTLLEKLGPELAVLSDIDIATIEKTDVPLLGEAIKRMRQNKIILFPGYDGEYGKISIFDPQERATLLGQKTLFMLPEQPKSQKDDGNNEQVLAKKNNKTAKRARAEDKFIREKAKTEKPETVLKLNSKQKTAVEHDSGPLMIIAGPGTGKTRTLTHRIVHLVNNKGVSPQTVLAITFTNKAADEMRERLQHSRIKSEALPFVGTFHGFCFEMLKEYNEKPPTVIDENDRRALILAAIKQTEKDRDLALAKKHSLLEWIVFAKQNIIGPANDPIHVPDENKPIFYAVYKSYQKILSISESYDFEDLIFATVRLLERDKTFTKTVRERFKYVFIDEFQDINHGQYRMVKTLIPAQKKGAEICVVGDPDQAIYGFRGSDVKYFNGFIDDYPDTTIVNLTQNYRSTKTIIDASQQIMGRKEKKAARVFSNMDGIKTVSVLQAASERAEAVTVGKIIENLIGGVGFHSFDFNRINNTENEIQRSFSEFAVLFRTADQIDIFAKIFDAAGLPYQVVSRKRIFDEANIKKLISWLKIVEGLGNSIDFERTMKSKGSGFSERELEQFNHWCYQKKRSFAAALSHARRFPISGFTRKTQRKLAALGDDIAKARTATAGMTIEKKITYFQANNMSINNDTENKNTKEAMKHLCEVARSARSDMSVFLARISLHADTDILRPTAERVALMTMHAAKGLEFPVVFIAGCEDGYVPFKRSNKDKPDTEEEKRLFYVALTRARERVYFAYAKKRRIYGKMRQRTISPFVEEIESELKHYEKSAQQQKRKKRSEQLPLF